MASDGKIAAISGDQNYQPWSELQYADASLRMTAMIPEAGKPSWLRKMQ
jgi:hypothetical protein